MKKGSLLIVAAIISVALSVTLGIKGFNELNSIAPRKEKVAEIVATKKDLNSAVVKPRTYPIKKTTVAKKVSAMTLQANNKTQPEICSYKSGRLEWGKDFSSWDEVGIDCGGDKIILRSTITGSVFNITTKRWESGADHGDLFMSPASSGNIIAEGVIGVRPDPKDTGDPIRLKKGFS